MENSGQMCSGLAALAVYQNCSSPTRAASRPTLLGDLARMQSSLKATWKSQGSCNGRQWRIEMHATGLPKPPSCGLRGCWLNTCTGQVGEERGGRRLLEQKKKSSTQRLSFWWHLDRTPIFFVKSALIFNKPPTLHFLRVNLGFKFIIRAVTLDSCRCKNHNLGLPFLFNLDCKCPSKSRFFPFP